MLVVFLESGCDEFFMFVGVKEHCLLLESCSLEISGIELEGSKFGLMVRYLTPPRVQK